ncbi:hypothetical protein LUZ63_017279 [Rhynchospora breviuscula]|uniref:Protein kinase domain-containing protein n=1 Tax=Rhynchospora breviuscula TaxID=2022672 RepID=A0A9Q0HFX4_9POAL|nr:hypothetical protein LUZ63_017279 [Rhynchospora breviuscula]
MIGSLHHTNLVKLLGYCFENHEKLLVYEFLPNRSLNKVLFDPMGRKQLVWKRRFMIIEGICRGLLYLHRDSGKNIIHRDLKPENILLDRDMTPKIADFDLAKTFDIENTHENTEFVGGTFGYMAPELSRHRRFSTKSDVYSYGVMVLEILTGEKISEFEGSSHSMSLVDYVWQHWNAEAALAVVDPYMSNEYQRDEVVKCIQVGLLCVQSDPMKRPSMQEVLVMLHNNRDSLPVPSNPGYLSQHRIFTF